MSGTSSSIRTKLWWNSHWMVLFQNCVRKLHSPTKMATTVQLCCYWKQLWSRWAITGSWEPLVRICNHFHTPYLDLFASRLNNKKQFFVSWSFDPEAQFTDAFSISWENFEPYIFPPFCLIAKVLNKNKEDNVKKAILVVPFWPTETWFSILISVLIFSPC